MNYWKLKSNIKTYNYQQLIKTYMCIVYIKFILKDELHMNEDIMEYITVGR